MALGTTQNGDLAVDSLISATRGFPGEYFRWPSGSTRAGRYYERMYCYELYHRWRPLIQSRLSGYVLNGELDKRAWMWDAIPDFLVHMPNTDNNALAVEVKVVGNDGNSLDMNKVIHDLEKLRRAEDGYLYMSTAFLLVGDDQDAWDRTVTAFQRMTTAARPSRTNFLWHKTSTDGAHLQSIKAPLR